MGQLHTKEQTLEWRSLIAFKKHIRIMRILNEYCADDTSLLTDENAWKQKDQRKIELEVNVKKWKIVRISTDRERRRGKWQIR